MIKFIHIADMHFDAAFDSLNNKTNLGQVRRFDQRIIFNNIIEIIKSEQIPYLFIAGDFYEQKYIRESTIEFINTKFKEIPYTRIFIAPGNHDPFLKNSFYNTYSWSPNVKIFTGKIEKVELPDFNLYGFGFSDYNSSVSLNINLDHKKPNILLMHASLDGNDNYNSVSSTFLQKLGFDYVALGHIHKTNFNEERNIIYPGSTLAMGFDELGKHGIVKGEITDKLHISFIPTDNREYIEKFVDISNMTSSEDLIEYANNLDLSTKYLYKIVLTGYKNFEIINNIFDFMPQNVIKIKDETSTEYDLNAIAKENSLKGLFVRNLLEKLPNNELEVKKAIEIGLSFFD